MTTLLLLAIVATVSLFAPGLIGATLINIAGFFIGITGMLLDLALRYLVVDFGTYIYTPVAGAIGNTIWAAFRDISNILIIGMFTLIAVSIILGIQSFNAKRMVAQVLIVAVLINFSLLFTRIIIEASNFVAGKFYSAMAIDSSVNAASATSGAGNFNELIQFASKSGISGQFINLLGLPSAFNARDTVNSVYSANNTSTLGKLTGISASGSVAAVIYSAVTAALLLATSIVLAYAVFLLIARTTLLLFLLATSALAFGAHLIPKWGDKYWKMWWEMLLRSALFGPLLMLMLWTTMTLSYALVQGAGVRSFDKLFSDPTNGSGILALLIFFLILAMLYASIRFASSFSSKIVGFDWAAMTPQLITRTGIAGSAMVGRKFGGGLAARALQTQKVAGMKGVRGRILRNTLAGAATASWDARNLPGVAKATKELGLNLGKVMNKGGYVQGLKDREEKIKKAEAIRSELIGRETGAEKRKQQDAKNVVGKADQKSNDLKGLQAQAADVQKTALQSAEKELSQMQTRLKEERERMFGVMGDPSAASAKRNDIDKLEEAIRTQTDKIERVKQGNDEEVKKKLGDLPSRIEKLTDSIKEQKDATEEASTYLKQMKEGKIGPKARQEAHARTVETNRYFTLLGNKPKSREIADKIRGEFRKSKDQKEKDKLVKLLSNLEKDGGKPEVKTEEKNDNH